MDAKNPMTDFARKKQKNKHRRKAKKNYQEASTLCKDETQGPEGSQSINDKPQSTNSVGLSNDLQSSVSNKAPENQKSHILASQDLSKKQRNKNVHIIDDVSIIILLFAFVVVYVGATSLNKLAHRIQ